MRAFLEQYGIAIFVLIIIGIMTLMGSSLGHTIEGLVTQEVKRFTDKAVSENKKIQNNNSDSNNNDVITLKFKSKDMYNKGEVVFDYKGVSGEETTEEFLERLEGMFDETAFDYDISFYKISDEPVDENTIFYVEQDFKTGTYGGLTISAVYQEGELTSEFRTLRGVENVNYFNLRNVNGTNDSYPYLINVPETFTYNYAGLNTTLTEGLWFYDSCGITLKYSDYVKITKTTLRTDTVNILGMDCIKIDDCKVTKDNLLGKTMKLSISSQGQNINESIEITEDLITESGFNLILMDTVVFTSNGAYIPIDVASMGIDNCEIEIK